jgi:hypothetical protein
MNLRENVKKQLDRLPLGIGAKYIIPALRSFYLNRVYLKIVRQSTARLEAKRILDLMVNRNVERVIIVYDLLCSPPTYGDLIDSQLMLARYFLKKDIQTDLYIVNSGYRHDWSALSKEEKETLIKDLQGIAQIVLGGESANIEVISWSRLVTILPKEESAPVLVPFEDRITRRESVYDSGLNIINYLISTEDKEFCDQFLLSFEEISAKMGQQKPEIPYISWHCRYSVKWGLERNISDEDFLRIYSVLKTLYPKHALMIISDRVGYEHFCHLAQAHNLECLFSKEYSETFMGDGALILGGDYYFQLRGGGMYVFPIFSRLPYEIIASTMNQVFWKKNRITSWANDWQRFIDATIGLPNTLNK